MNKFIRFFNSKNKREIVILIIVVGIAITTIIYANQLANKIEKQEESQVILWAKAISEKSKVLRLSNEIFLKLAEEERKKVEITSKTTQLMSTENIDDKAGSLFLDIMRLNDQIPIIYTDENLIVTDYRNMEGSENMKGTKLSKAQHPEFFNYPPIEISFLNKKNYIFYRESIIFQKISNIIRQSGNQFIDEITNNSSLLPVILLDKNNKLISSGNIPKEIATNQSKLADYIDNFTQQQKPIIIDIDPQNKKYLYYKKSNIASYIKWFPVGLYTILAILIFLAFSAIKNTRNFEKNQIWVGMSKETAHQLGTPISSLGAWLEVFEESENLAENQRNVLYEMKKDVNRLSLIADRFSKIGSKPKLEAINLSDILSQCFDYLKKRASKKVHFTLLETNPNISIEINRQLFEWVIENVVKNAFDAIPNEGTIQIKTSIENNKVYIDIKDSGKGIQPSETEKIFEPGYTTKKRGWGLGLSLCKRIIEDYFNGKIFILWSKPNLGTTIRIELKRV